MASIAIAVHKGFDLATDDEVANVRKLHPAQYTGIAPLHPCPVSPDRHSGYLALEEVQLGKIEVAYERVLSGNYQRLFYLIWDARQPKRNFSALVGGR